MTLILQAPEFPPLLKGQEYDKKQGLMAYTIAEAEKGSLSAGDLVWSSATHVAHCAIVLEPEITRDHVLSMIPLAMVALSDSLGAIGPPNLAITFGWPNEIFANGAHVGFVKMKFPPKVNRDEIPDFAVLEFSLDITWCKEDKTNLTEPGNDLGRTVLHEEGAGELDRTQIIESWSRHFLTWIDTWQQDGFKAVQENWLFRAKDRNEFTSVTVGNNTYQGKFLGLDEHGGLLLKGEEGVSLIPMADLWFKDQSSGVNCE